MNKEWSELNKKMQMQIRSKATFDEGIDTLLLLRSKLMEQIIEFRKTLRHENFAAMPFRNANGYHSKTVAYSLFHVFRIEDIVANSLIRKSEQVFFAGDYAKKMNSPINTTGNELADEEIAKLSSMLNIDALYEYIKAVDESTARLLRELSHQDMKIKMTEEDKKRLLALGTVSEQENACWLIDYWCGKDIKGLIQMPFSRHWIMHVEAAVRIKKKLCRD